MLVSLIAALDEGNGIGFQGALPWNLPADMRHFRRLTLHHHVVMGRKTYESIGRALPGRIMLVVTHQPDYQAPDCLVVPSLDAALKRSHDAGEEEVFIIGGQSIYNQSLPLADRLYLTRVHACLDADAFFPLIVPSDWRLIDSVPHATDGQHIHAFTFEILERVNCV